MRGSILFSGKGATSVMEGLSEINVGHIDESFAGLQTILNESSHDMYKELASHYISDLMMTEKVMEGAQLEPLLEGFMSNTWEKLKKIFKTMWAKLRSWYDKARSFIRSLFLTGEKFVNEFGEKIRSKEVGKFTYSGYSYTISDGNSHVDGINAKIDKILLDQVNFSTELSQMESGTVGRSAGSTEEWGQKTKIGNSAHANGDGKLDRDEVKKLIVAALGKDDITAGLKLAREKYRGNADEEEEQSDIGSKRGAMLDFVKGEKAATKEINDAQSDTDDKFKKVLAAIDRAKSDIDSGEKDEAKRAKKVAFASHKFNVAKDALNVKQQLNGIKLDAYKEAGRNYITVLKMFLHYRPAKEGFGADDSDTTRTDSQFEGESLFEAALRNV